MLFLTFFSGRYGGWHSRDTDRASNKKSLPRILVYIMGGTTFSEFRVGYEITNERKNWEVIVGKCYILRIIVPNISMSSMELFIAATEGHTM